MTDFSKGSVDSLPVWWSMVKAQEELVAEGSDTPSRLSDPNKVILNFMGSGASCQVTVADLDALSDFVKANRKEST